MFSSFRKCAAIVSLNIVSPTFSQFLPPGTLMIRPSHFVHHFSLHHFHIFLVSLAALWITLFSLAYTSSFNFSSDSSINCFMFQKLEFLFLKLFLEIQFFKTPLFIPSNFLQIGKLCHCICYFTNITSLSIIQYLTISIPAVLSLTLLCPMTHIHSHLFSHMFGGIIL